MKIEFLAAGNENYPSSRYRAYNLAKELNKLGLETKVIPAGSKKYFFNLFLEFIKLLYFRKKIIYIQKITHPLVRFLCLLHKLKGDKIIFDFDDTIFILEPKRVRSMINDSDIVIIGNNYLADYAKKYNKNVFVIPTSIDLDRIEKLKKNYSIKDKKVIIGWIGSESTLKYLKEVKKLLEKLSKKYSLELWIIGPENSLDGLRFFKNINIKVIPWKLETEWKELSKIDIGIMPLLDDPWTRGKCGLKALQYMALGIPAIASNVGANKEIIQNGKNGFLASNEKEWIYYLEKLIKNPKLREKLGKAGRKTVEKDYSLEKNARKLAKIIKSLENK